MGLDREPIEFWKLVFLVPPNGCTAQITMVNLRTAVFESLNNEQLSHELDKSRCKDFDALGNALMNGWVSLEIWILHYL